MCEKWSSDKVFVFVDAQESEREREEKASSVHEFQNNVTVKDEKELI